MIVTNRLRPPKVVLIFITTLANGSTIFIHSDVLHPRVDYLPIVKLIGLNCCLQGTSFVPAEDDIHMIKPNIIQTSRDSLKD